MGEEDRSYQVIISIVTVVILAVVVIPGIFVLVLWRQKKKKSLNLNEQPEIQTIAPVNETNLTLVQNDALKLEI